MSSRISAVSQSTLVRNSLRRVSRVIVSTASMYVLTHLVAFAMLPAGVALSYRDSARLSRLKVRFAAMLFRVVGKEVEVAGIQHVAAERGYVIVTNYPSFYVLFALMALFPDASFVAHRFLRRVPLLGWLLARSGTIFVDPRRPLATRQAMDEALAGRRTRSIVIMPESRRTPDGEIHGFRRGFAYLLKHSNLDLLPITANGFHTLKPVNRPYLDPDAQPTLVIHRPVPNTEARILGDIELVRRTESTIRSAYRA